jgi:hypothetical protein
MDSISFSQHSCGFKAKGASWNELDLHSSPWAEVKEVFTGVRRSPTRRSSGLSLSSRLGAWSCPSTLPQTTQDELGRRADRQDQGEQRISKGQGQEDLPGVRALQVEVRRPFRPRFLPSLTSGQSRQPLDRER